VVRVTLTDRAAASGRHSSRSWTVVKALDWIDCGPTLYFLGRDRSGWHVIWSLPTEDVLLVVEV